MPKRAQQLSNDIILLHSCRRLCSACSRALNDTIEMNIVLRTDLVSKHYTIPTFRLGPHYLVC